MRYLAILILGLILLSCDKDNEIIDDNQFNSCDSIGVFELTEQELYDTAYADFKYYNGFYTEELNGGSIYFLNTVSVYQSTPWIYLCTDSYDTALNWSETSNNNSSVNRELVSTNENEKYYEFVRVNPSHDADILLSRVFKCSYFDPTLYEELNDSLWILGTLNKENKTETICRTFFEFYNFIHTFNSNSYKFVSSETCESANDFFVMLYEIKITHGDYGIKDRISLIKHEYVVNKSSGLINFSKSVMQVIEGMQN